MASIKRVCYLNAGQKNEVKQLHKVKILQMKERDLPKTNGINEKNQNAILCKC